jgi:hypothetical protein
MVNALTFCSLTVTWMSPFSRRTIVAFALTATLFSLAAVRIITCPSTRAAPFRFVGFIVIVALIAVEVYAERATIKDAITTNERFKAKVLSFS